MLLEALERQQVPLTQAEYDAYIEEVKTAVHKKYENLIKNAH